MGRKVNDVAMGAYRANAKRQKHGPRYNSTKTNNIQRAESVKIAANL